MVGPGRVLQIQLLCNKGCISYGNSVEVVEIFIRHASGDDGILKGRVDAPENFMAMYMDAGVIEEEDGLACRTIVIDEKTLDSGVGMYGLGLLDLGDRELIINDDWCIRLATLAENLVLGCRILHLL